MRPVGPPSRPGAAGTVAALKGGWAGQTLSVGCSDGGVHTATAHAFGVDEGLVVALLGDVGAAPVAERMRPVLRYVAKLTRTPSRMTPADAEAVLAAGWDERALHDAVSVCALFNFMDRLVEGLGIQAGEEYFRVAAERLACQGYAGLLAPSRLDGAEQGGVAGGHGPGAGEG